MAGDLWQGYLDAQAADVAEVEREEQKKKQRLEEQLQKLNMEGLRRRIDINAQKWEIEQTARTRSEEALSRLRDFLPPEYIDAALTGIDLSDLRPKKEQEPWFIGTPYEERGLGKEFYIKPEGTESYGEWLRGERTKSLLKDRAGEPAERETKLKDYHQKFLTAWGKELDEQEEDTPENKFKFFREWRDGNVLPGYKNELGKRLGMYRGNAIRIKKTPTEAPPQEPKQVYNTCRNAGGTHEECLAKAGVSLP